MPRCQLRTHPLGRQFLPPSTQAGVPDWEPRAHPSGGSLHGQGQLEPPAASPPVGPKSRDSKPTSLRGGARPRELGARALPGNGLRLGLPSIAEALTPPPVRKNPTG